MATRKAQPDFIPAEETPDFIPAEAPTQASAQPSPAAAAPRSVGWLPSGFNPGHMLGNAAANLTDLLPSGINPLHPVDNFKANSTLQPVHGQAVPFAEDISAAVGGNLGSLVAHPIKSLAGMATFGKNDPLSQRLQQAKDEWRADPGLAIAHGLGDVATGVITDAAVKAPTSIPGAIRTGLTAAADEPIIGTGSTPRARYQAAKRLGVNLDLADATGSDVAKGLKSINEHSLFGSGTYEATKAANLSALNDATKGAVEEMSPYDRETGGYKLQNLLKQHQEGLKSSAQRGFNEIDTQYGDHPVANPDTLSSVAHQIQKEEAPHLAQFPSLRPGKVAAVVDDAARFGKPPDTLAPGIERPALAPPLVPTIGDALKARSGILDMYQNNPEIVKSAADAQLQRLVGATHDTVMDSLPEGARTTLRDAQTTWKSMKEAYDDPSSPLYHALRTDTPSTTVTGIGPATPESIRDLVGRVGPEGRGVIQRGTTEKALGTTASGEYDFRGFPNRFAKIPQDYASELYKNPSTGAGSFLPKLRDISSTAQALSKDLNPSGTAKQGQKLAEAAALLPTGGAPLLQYPLAKLINSPRFVDWIMRDPAAAKALQSGGVSALKNVIPMVLPEIRRKSGTR